MFHKNLPKVWVSYYSILMAGNQYMIMTLQIQPVIMKLWKERVEGTTYFAVNKDMAGLRQKCFFIYFKTFEPLVSSLPSKYEVLEIIVLST